MHEFKINQERGKRAMGWKVREPERVRKIKKDKASQIKREKEKIGKDRK